MLLPMIQQVLARMLVNRPYSPSRVQAQPQQPSQPSLPSQSSVPAPPRPQALALSERESRILSALYLSDASGTPKPGLVLSALEGTTADGRLGAGDTIRVTDAAGALVFTRTLTASDVYALRFRENVLRYAERMHDGGWGFSEQNVDLTTGTLSPPQTRRYVDPSGASGTETVLKRNAYWEIVERAGQRYMLQRPTDDRGAPVLPSQAIRDVFDNPQHYRFDCATPIRLLNLAATLETIGEDDFNRRAERLQINSWYDQHDSSAFDGGFEYTGRTLPAGAFSVGGRANLQGEFAPFDPVQSDRLIPGDAYYFERPGDRSSPAQGWNAVYLGRHADGTYRFWSSERGIEEVRFVAGTWIPATTFNGHYLSAARASPNLTRLAAWDADQSALA